ncbi:MAG: ATP synthase F1 subunit epsilon [Thermodesulfobacteriota bacterium]
MADNFLLEIITPYRKLLSEEVEVVTAPGELGEFGVLAGHAHFFTLLKAGRVTYKTGRESASIAVSRGYAEVGPEKTTLLVDGAAAAGEIDLPAVREELREAEEKLNALTENDPDWRSATEAVEYAEARISVKED